MKLQDIMTTNVIRISPEESVAVASRLLTNYNIGALPVCSREGKVCGILTDRDIVTRCLAAEKSPKETAVREIMTRGINAVRPDMELKTAASLMRSNQIRRLPVMQDGKLCGIVSLGDLAAKGEAPEEVGETLSGISEGVSRRI